MSDLEKANNMTETTYKFSDFIPPVGDFVRMPAGSTTYYPASNLAEVASGVASYANRIGGKVTTAAMIVIDPKTLGTMHLLKCQVVIPGSPRGSRGRPPKA